MTETERHIGIARRIIQIALDQIDLADQALRQESGKTKPQSEKRPATKPSKETSSK